MTPKLYQPLKAPIVYTQRFGLNPQIYKQFGLKGHNGIDYRTRTASTPNAHRHVYAMAGGVVMEAKDQDIYFKGMRLKRRGYGRYVRIMHPDGAQSVYGHLEKFYVKAGQAVSKDTIIGLTGNTGFSTGPHLHVGYRPADWQKIQGNGYAGYVNFEPYLIQR